MADASTLISYQGNPVLGGANPVVSPDSFSQITKSVMDMALLDRQQNFMMFQQKVKDRDALRDMFEKGIIPSGEMDANDKAVYDESEKRTLDAYGKIKGINDQDAIREFYTDVGNLQNIVTHGQERGAMFKTLEQNKADAALKSDQDAIQSFIDKQKGKGFWERIDPYQKTHTFDPSKIYQYGTFAASPERMEERQLDGFGVIPFDIKGEQKFDWKATQAAANADYLTPEGAENQRQLGTMLNSLSPDDRDAAIKAANERIQLYDDSFGLKDGDTSGNYVKPIDYDPNTGIIKELPNNLAAKWALANQKAYNVAGTATPNKELLTYKKGMADLAMKAQQEKDRMTLGYARINAQSELNNAKIKALESSNEDPTPYLQNQWRSNFVDQQNITDDRIDATTSMPITTFKNGKLSLLKPIGAKPVWENPNPKDPSKPSDPFKAKVVGYTGGYYQRSFVSPDGRRKKVEDVMNDYTDWVQAHKNLKGNPPSFQEWLTNNIQKGYLKVHLSGAEGGEATEDNYTETQKAYNNQYTKKGQNQVISSLIAEPDATINDGSSDNDNSTDNSTDSTDNK